MQRFGGANDILSRTILVNGENTSIIGVMPPDFRFTDENGEYLAPLPLNHFQLRGSARFLTVAAKLKPGATMQQAQSEMDAISHQLAGEFPARDTDHGKPWTIRLQPIHQALFGDFNRPLLLLQAAAGVRVADCLRERGGVAFGAVGIPIDRSGNPSGARSQPWPHLPPVHDGEPAAFDFRREPGNCSGMGRRPRAGGHGAILAAQTARDSVGRACAAVHDGGLGSDRFDIRSDPRGSGIEDGVRRIAQERNSRRNRGRRTEPSARDVGCGAAGAGTDAADRIGTVDPELPHAAGRRPWLPAAGFAHVPLPFHGKSVW